MAYTEKTRKLLVLDSVGGFSLTPYLRQHAINNNLDWRVDTMHNLSNDQMWEILKNFAPDTVFVDFCNENAVVLTNRVKELPKQPKIVIRLHGYEAQSWYIFKIDWSTVSNLLVVSPKFEEIVLSKIPAVKEKLNVVFNLIDTEKFALQKAEDMVPNTIAYAGYLNKKKGIPLLRTVMASMPDKEFHVAGIFQDAQVELYLKDLALPNVQYHGWVKTWDFLKGKQHVISTSVTESFGMSLAEGMAMGLTPLIHAWPGADLIWPKECIWKTFDELKAIQPQDPAWCRKWITDRYPMNQCIETVTGMLFN